MWANAGDRCIVWRKVGVAIAKLYSACAFLVELNGNRNRKDSMALCSQEIRTRLLRALTSRTTA